VIVVAWEKKDQLRRFPARIPIMAIQPPTVRNGSRPGWDDAGTGVIAGENPSPA